MDKKIPTDNPNKVYKKISNINRLKNKYIYLKKIKKHKNGDMYLDLNELKKFL